MPFLFVDGIMYSFSRTVALLLLFYEMVGTVILFLDVRILANPPSFLCFTIIAMDFESIDAEKEKASREKIHTRSELEIGTKDPLWRVSSHRRAACFFSVAFTEAKEGRRRSSTIGI